MSTKIGIIRLKIWPKNFLRGPKMINALIALICTALLIGVGYAIGIIIDRILEAKK
jgi:hypothetical protein